MPGATRIVQKRRINRSSQSRGSSSRLGLGCAGTLSLAISVALLALALVYADLSRDLPSPQFLHALLDPQTGLFREPTRLYDRSGTRELLALQSSHAADAEYLPVHLPLRDPAVEISQGEAGFSPFLVDATLAAVDEGFWNHAGFSFEGIQEDAHPTLAQRLVSELMLRQEEPGLRRSLRERLLAAQVTSYYGREQVLEWWLNYADYGRFAYGADAAAHLYLDKSASQLTLGEAALLTAISQAPALNPLDAPEAALEGQRLVLISMLNQGYISSQEMSAALNGELHFRDPSVVEDPDPNSTFLGLALAQARTTLGKSQVDRGGLRIYTTMDYDLQLQASCAVEEQLNRLGGIVSTNLSGCDAARLLPTRTTGETSGPQLLAEATIVEPSTGQILAAVTHGEGNPGGTPHPAGSILTPFVYLTGFTRGMSPATLLWDIQDSDQQLPNLDVTYHGPLRLRTALANDYASPAWQVYTRVNAETAAHTARQFGLSLSPSTHASTDQQIPFGEENILLLDAVAAYSVLANEGVMAGMAGSTTEAIQPIALLRVLDLEGRTLLNWERSEARPVIAQGLAYLLNHTLSDESARWSALGHPNPLEIGRPAAAKIGRTHDQNHAWTIGYTPQLAIGVWIGSESGDAHWSAPAGLWHALMQYASSGLPALAWSVPSDVHSIQVCDPSGLLPTRDCPNVVAEVFLSGTEPTTPDNIFQAVQVNRETGRLATVFTPPELVESRVYLRVPAEAREWAEQAGVETPPETYDVISVPPASPNVHIASPEMFAHTGSTVFIEGTAYAEDLDFYRLQAGRGLNPTAWVQIGEDNTRSVRNGRLGMWDTSGLQGLYALQLVLVHKDQRVESFTTQVTVDNQPPWVGEPEVLVLDQQGEISLQVEVFDDLDLDRVQFLINGRLVEERRLPPYTALWNMREGKHTLIVRAFDRAGNITEASTSFQVP